VKVKLNSARCGHIFDKDGRQCGEFSQQAGDVVEIENDEAQRLINKGFATRANDTK
jgi:hypothetical protein